MKWLVFALFSLFLLTIQNVKANSIGIGIEPSLINVTLIYERNITIPLKFWNEGDTDAIYNITPEDTLKNWIILNDSVFLVPKNTNRMDNYVLKNITFISKINETSTFETGFSVYGSPTIQNDTGMITIKRRIFVTIYIKNHVAVAPIITTTTSLTSTTTISSITTVTTTEQVDNGGGNDSPTTTTIYTPSNFTTTTTHILPILPATTTKTTSMLTSTSTNATTQETIKTGYNPTIIIIAVIIIILIVCALIYYMLKSPVVR